MTTKQSPFACDMSAIPAAERDAHMATIKRLFHSVATVEEVSNGYRFRLSGDPDVLMLAAEFIALEGLCCPFFAFGLELEAEKGAVWLSLTGREGVKPFILAEIGDHLTGTKITSSRPR